MYITCKRLLNVECVSGNLKLAIVFLNGISSNKLLGAYWKEVTKSRGEHLLSSPVVNQAYLSPIIQFTHRVITVFQAATILVVMGSRKKFRQLKLWWKSPSWRPVSSNLMPRYSQEIPKILWDAFSFMLCFLDNLPNFTLVLRVLILEMSRSPPNFIAMVGQSFWFCQTLM